MKSKPVLLTDLLFSLYTATTFLPDVPACEWILYK